MFLSKKRHKFKVGSTRDLIRKQAHLILWLSFEVPWVVSASLHFFATWISFLRGSDKLHLTEAASFQHWLPLPNKASSSVGGFLQYGDILSDSDHAYNHMLEFRSRFSVHRVRCCCQEMHAVVVVLKKLQWINVNFPFPSLITLPSNSPLASLPPT